ncbi:MAG: class E sortase [Oscillospiraceae bacterium]
MKGKKWAPGFLLVAAGLLLALSLFLLWRSAHPALPQPAITPPPTVSVTVSPSPTPTETPPALESDGLPHDQLFITVERQKYQSGDLQLKIPKLSVDVPVLNGVDPATLLQGIGLYDYAQLPGDGDRNVSIAGHRNGVRNGVITDDMPFYYLDTLTAGDCLYLTDESHIYQYAFEDQTVVEPDDWGPIYSQGFSCLTLTSCTPITTATHRIIIRARLLDTLDLTDDYAYPATVEKE